MWPGNDGIINPDIYNQMFIMHGTIMIFFAITPLLIGAFGNFIIQLQIGVPDIAFPKLNMLSFWTMFLGSVVVLSSYCLPTGTAASGWTSYPPLSPPASGIPGFGGLNIIPLGFLILVPLRPIRHIYHVISVSGQGIIGIKFLGSCYAK